MDLLQVDRSHRVILAFSQERAEREASGNGNATLGRLLARIRKTAREREWEEVKLHLDFLAKSHGLTAGAPFIFLWMMVRGCLSGCGWRRNGGVADAVTFGNRVGLQQERDSRDWPELVRIATMPGCLVE